MMKKIKNTHKRPELKNVIYLGTASKEVIDKVKEQFDSHSIYVMSKEMFNKVTELFILQNIEWKEEQSLREFTTKPDKIREAYESAKNTLKAVGRKWFSVGKLVEETSFNYAQAKSVIDVLYAFGLVVIDKTIKKQPRYMIIENKYQRLEYLRSIIKGLEKETDEMKRIEEVMEKELKEEAKESAKGKLKVEK